MNGERSKSKAVFFGEIEEEESDFSEEENTN